LAEISLRYRFIVGAILLAAFALLVGMREFKWIHEYELVLHFLGVDAVTQMPFVDFHGVLSAAECSRRGVDVYISNPCDIFGRVHMYSPLWLTLIPSSLGTADTWWAGAAVAITFLLSLAWLCPARTWQEFLIFLALCCSSAVVFATERANIDIVVFILTLIAGKTFASQTYRPASYSAIFLAAALKFYPFAALSAVTADRTRQALLIGALGVLAAIGFEIVWHREIALAIEHFPVRYDLDSDMFSARDLVEGPVEYFPNLLSFIKPHARALTFFLILLSIIAAASAAILLQARSICLVREPEETVWFLCGGAMIVFCFFVGHNIHYRAILLLLTVPLLFAWTRTNGPTVRLIGWAGISLVAFAVFENILRMNSVSVIARYYHHYYRATFLFWLLEQAVWWALVTGLTMAIFLLAWDLPTGRWLRASITKTLGIERRDGETVGKAGA
jgi:hypothetical protein